VASLGFADLDTASQSRYTSPMMLLGARARSFAVLLLAVCLVAVAVITGLVVTGEIAGRRLTGAVVVFETDVARFERDIRANLTGSTPFPEDDEQGMCAAAASLGLTRGQTVVLHDEAGLVIGRGTLGRAEAIREAGSSATTGALCRLPFSIVDIRSSRRLSIEVGSRTMATYDSAELDARFWHLELRVER
jgi:hypothetical protein